MTAPDILSGSVEEATGLAATPSYPSTLATTTLAIAGMTCNKCVTIILAAVGDLPGVQSVSVSREQGTAEVRHQPSLAPTPAILATIGALVSGKFTASLLSTTAEPAVQELVGVQDER